MTQVQLADVAGVRAGLIAKVEQGERRVTVGEAAALAGALEPVGRRHGVGTWRSARPRSGRSTTENELTGQTSCPLSLRRCTRPAVTGWHLYNATVIDLQAEGMWPTDTQLEWTVTTLVIGLPRTVVVQRCRRVDVDLVLRDDGAVWPAFADEDRVATSPPP